MLHNKIRSLVLFVQNIKYSDDYYDMGDNFTLSQRWLCLSIMGMDDVNIQFASPRPILVLWFVSLEHNSTHRVHSLIQDVGVETGLCIEVGKTVSDFLLLGDICFNNK